MTSNAFASLKKKRSTNMESLNNELQKMDRKSGGADDRYWKIECDKAGNGYAVIRFLDTPANEDFPFVRIMDHGFKGPGGWYIENSRVSIGEPDFAKEYISSLWDKGTEEAKTTARAIKMRTSFHANILVIKDPANPQNEGKVMLYKFGKSIMDKLSVAMNPEFDDETPLNPFDMWEGADFKLKAKNGSNNFRTYEASAFAAPKAIAAKDADIEAIWNQTHSLQELLDPATFKSYDDLKAKFLRAMKISDPAQVNVNAGGMTGAPTQQAAPAAPQPATDPSGDEDGIAFFQNLSNE